jgi:hypothetical protein
VKMAYTTVLVLLAMAIIGKTESLVDSICEYDWNNDGIMDQFIFHPYFNESEPADFLNISINISNKITYNFNSQDSAWVKHNRNECYAPVKMIKDRSLIKSDYAALFDVKINNKSRPFLFLFGFAPANEPGLLDIYCLNKENTPVNIYSKRDDLCDILDIDNDGYSEIVLYPNHEYCENYYKEYTYSTYEPYYVYRITENNNIQFNKILTALYNKKHYVGWVGLDSSHHYIIWNNPKTNKRVLTTLNEARKKYFK